VHKSQDPRSPALSPSHRRQLTHSSAAEDTTMSYNLMS
jgi:hypothetical protein